MPTTDRHDTPGLFYPVMKILVDCLQVAETGGGDQKLQLLLWNGTGGLARAPYPATATSSPDTWEPCDRPHWYNLCAFPNQQNSLLAHIVFFTEWQSHIMPLL